MSAPTGAAGLYHRAIVEAARKRAGAGRLENPDASISLDNPLCGDRVSIDVNVDSGRLTALAHRVKGCLLCEAAASVLGANAIGANAEKVAGIRDSLEQALASGFERHTLAWPDLAMFAPVVAHRSRRRCVTLPLEALCAAMAEARRPRGED